MMNPKELTSNKIFDRLAETYRLASDKNVPSLESLLLERFTKPTDVCLDIGVGTGVFSIPIAYRVQEVHGVDISTKMLEQCRRNLVQTGLTNVYLYERSASDLMFPDRSFDVVFSFSTLVLVPEPLNAYRELLRVLKPGCVAILDITGKYNLSRIFWTRFYRQQGHFGLNYYAQSEISSILLTLGFEILEKHATGLLDQWRYIIGLNRLTFLEKVIHHGPCETDLDYKLSQKFSGLANRWYFVLRKKK